MYYVYVLYSVCVAVASLLYAEDAEIAFLLYAYVCNLSELEPLYGAFERVAWTFSSWRFSH